MNRKEYFKLSLQQQVDYFNKRMDEGKSFNDTCKEILLSKGSISNKFKNHDYILINGQYMIKQIPVELDSIEYEKEPQFEEVVLELQDIKEVLEESNITQEQETVVEQRDEIELELDNIKPVGSNSDKKNKKATNKDKKAKLKAKAGRPQKYKKDDEGKNIDKKKFTLEIDKKVYKALKHKKTEEGIAINLFVEDLLRKAIEDKYFKNII